MFSSRIVRIGLASAAAIIVAALIAWLQVNSAVKMAPAPAAAVGGPFQLMDHTGRAVTDADFHGRHLLIYFGYTYCPDVCPTELSAMAQALDRLGLMADKVQPLFISIDPERDIPAHLADYVALFHPRLTGLTGTVQQVAAAAKAYRVYAAKAPGWEKAGSDYLMDHSSFIYWMDDAGRFIAVFPAGTAPDAMAARMKERLGG